MTRIGKDEWVDPRDKDNVQHQHFKVEHEPNEVELVNDDEGPRDVGEMYGGLICLKTKSREALVNFYVNVIGMQLWLEQPGGITILKHGNMLLGFQQTIQRTPDLSGVITFVYPTTKQVDEMHERLTTASVMIIKVEGSITTCDVTPLVDKPLLNKINNVYHFHAKDPEGRRIEFQAFLQPLGGAVTSDPHQAHLDYDHYRQNTNNGAFDFNDDFDDPNISTSYASSTFNADDFLDSEAYVDSINDNDFLYDVEVGDAASAGASASSRVSVDYDYAHQQHRQQAREEQQHHAGDDDEYVRQMRRQQDERLRKKLEEEEQGRQRRKAEFIKKRDELKRQREKLVTEVVVEDVKLDPDISPSTSLGHEQPYTVVKPVSPTPPQSMQERTAYQNYYANNNVATSAANQNSSPQQSANKNSDYGTSSAGSSAAYRSNNMQQQSQQSQPLPTEPAKPQEPSFSTPPPPPSSANRYGSNFGVDYYYVDTEYYQNNNYIDTSNDYASYEGNRNFQNGQYQQYSQHLQQQSLLPHQPRLPQYYQPQYRQQGPQYYQPPPPPPPPHPPISASPQEPFSWKGILSNEERRGSTDSRSSMFFVDDD